MLVKQRSARSPKSESLPAEAPLLKFLAGLLLRARPAAIASGLAALGILFILAAIVLVIVSWE